jgi:hypothetical protein
VILSLYGLDVLSFLPPRWGFRRDRDESTVTQKCITDLGLKDGSHIVSGDTGGLGLAAASMP